MILKKIIEYKKEFIAERKRNISLKDIKLKIDACQEPRNFYTALLNPKTIPSVIAEVKKASPSKGVIRIDFNYIEFAKSYEKNMASAISVLTDEKFFQGSDFFLTAIKANVNLPLLRKDFIIDEYQIFESLAIGADAILLIVKCLTPTQISDFIAVAKSLKLGVLVEVHNVKEAEIALSAGAAIIGINNRNLETFEVDLQHTVNVSKSIPDTVLVVSESGIKTKDDISFLLKNSKIKAVLVGETLMRAKDPGTCIPKIIGKIS